MTGAEVVVAMNDITQEEYLQSVKREGRKKGQEVVKREKGHTLGKISSSRVGREKRGTN